MRQEAAIEAAKNKLVLPAPVVVSLFVPLPSHHDAEQLKPSPAQVSDRASLEKQVQELQAQVAALTLVIASSGNGSGVVPSSPAVFKDPGPVVSHGDMGAEDVAAVATATGEDPARESPVARSEVTVSCEQAPMVTSSTPGQQDSLRLGNGTVLCFSKQSVPDPPAISFATDIPWLIQIWDDSSAEWDPTRAVLRIQGQPIALKHWPDVYRYGTGQWAGIKKTWANWQVSFCPRFCSVTWGLPSDMTSTLLRAGKSLRSKVSGRSSLKVVSTCHTRPSVKK